jgi:two-component system, response regulator
MRGETGGILMVEDDPQDVELTLRAFRNENIGNRIQVVRDGEEALDYLFCRGEYSQRTLEQLPALILLDLKLPKVDGFQLIRQIRNSDECGAIPVVVLTSSGEPRDVMESYRLGANSYIQKPVDTREFRQAIRTLALYWLVVNRPPARDAGRTKGMSR